MSHIGLPLTVTVAQIGNLSRGARNALLLANQIQQAFHFAMYYPEFELDKERYKLPNSGFDLDKAVRNLVHDHNLPRPLIFMTSDPYGQQASREKEGAFIFADHRLPFDSEVSIVSTYLWDHLPGAKRLQPYILYSLATTVLMKYAGLEWHSEKPKTCPFFDSLEPEEIQFSLNGGDLCGVCERTLRMRLRKGQNSLEEVASARKLFNRAWYRRICFMVMPFDDDLKPVYEVVGKALREEGWIVGRADELVGPRSITAAILQAILTCDLVVADLSRTNPNVFYEVGLAHGIYRDVIMLTQEAKIPFDIADDRAIFYKADEPGLLKLDREIRRLAGNV